MARKLVVLLGVLLSLLILAAVSLFAERSTQGIIQRQISLGVPSISASESSIVVQGADAVRQEAFIPSESLKATAKEVTPRILADYADSIFMRNLAKPRGLGQAVRAVPPIILVEYADSLLRRELVKPKELSQAAANTPPRILVEYADSILNLDLEPPAIVTVNQPPVAKVKGKQNVSAGSSLTFDASPSYDPDGSIVSYLWDFGDGTTQSGKVVTHTYSKPGIYLVTLTVTDNKGVKSSEKIRIEVTERNNPPVIQSLVPEQEVLPLNGSCKITASATDLDGDILSYKWSCQGGTISGKGSAVTWKAPDKEGKYKISLRVEDGHGGSDEASLSIRVIAAPSPPPQKPGEPYVNLYGQKTEVFVGEEIILNLSVVNPITSPGKLKIQLTLRIPSGWSIASAEFGPSVGGLQTATYEIEQGENPQTIGVHIIANEPFEGFITGYIDYYFIEQPKLKGHREINQPVKASLKGEKTPQKPESTPKPPPLEAGRGLSGAMMAIISGIVATVIGGVLARLIWRWARKRA